VVVRPTEQTEWLDWHCDVRPLVWAIWGCPWGLAGSWKSFGVWCSMVRKPDINLVVIQVIVGLIVVHQFT